MAKDKKEKIVNSKNEKANETIGKHSKGATKSKKFHPFIFIIMLASIVTMIWSLYNIWTWYSENQKNNEVIEEVRSSISFEETVIVNEGTEEETKAIDFSELLKKNSDTVGWIKVNNSAIDYPVVQSNDNDYYLTHSFDKSYNSAGWIFADYRNKFDGTDKNIILYGHHRKDGSMFADVANALDSSWCENKENQIITFYTPTGTIKYQIFSSYKIAAETYYTTTYFSSDSNFLDFLKTLEKRSVYNYNVKLDETMPIITFSTCGATSSTRMVIHAQQIKD